MQYDYERAAAIINAFRDLVMEIKSIDKACQTEIKEADMAFCDIRHKCEIDYPKNRSTRTKICRLMKEYSVRRRNAKETLEVITPLVRFLDKNTHASNLIGQMANETRKALENTRRSKVYKARVLLLKPILEALLNENKMLRRKNSQLGGKVARMRRALNGESKY